MDAEPGWTYQGRQEHGWFGSGTKPKDDPAMRERDRGTSGPGAAANRIDQVAYSVIGYLPAKERRFAEFSEAERGRLRLAMAAWDAARGLSRDAFRETFMPFASDPVVDNLRGAARGAIGAQTQPELNEAGRQLASAVRQVGAERWRSFLNEASGRLVDDVQQLDSSQGATDSRDHQASLTRLLAAGPTKPAITIASEHLDDPGPVPVVLNDGTAVVDPKTGEPLVKPSGVSLEKNVRIGRELRDMALAAPFRNPISMYILFRRFGPMDYQRLYGDHSFNEKYANFGNYNFGAVAAAAGYSKTETFLAAAYVNYSSKGDHDAIYGNNSVNIRFIEAGYDAYQSGLIEK